MKYRNNILFIIFFILLLTSSCSGESKGTRFNRIAGEPEAKAEEIIKALDLKNETNVLDLGSGGGYFSLKVAKIVAPEGKVYAVDIDKDLLDFVKKEAVKENTSNIVYVLAKESGIPLEDKIVDFIFCRNVYHHLQDRSAYFRRIKRLLTANGKIAIIDYTKGGIFNQLFGHRSDPKDAEKEMKEAGFKVFKKFTFLPEQYFIIFEKED